MSYTIFNEFALLILAIVLIAVVAFTRVNALWLRLFIIDVFAITIVHRLDAISMYFWHYDLVSPGVTYILHYLVLGSGLFAFIAAYQRRVYLKRAEIQRRLDLLRKHQARIEWLESARSEAERGTSWDLEHRFYT